MTLILDIYLGSGIHPEADETITVARTRDGIAACRRRAIRIWQRVERVHPADDDIVSYGLPDGDGYVTLRRTPASGVDVE